MMVAVRMGRGTREEGRDSETPETEPRQTQMGLWEITSVPSVLNPAIESCSKPTASESRSSSAPGEESGRAGLTPAAVAAILPGLEPVRTIEADLL